MAREEDWVEIEPHRLLPGDIYTHDPEYDAWLALARVSEAEMRSLDLSDMDNCCFTILDQDTDIWVWKGDGLPCPKSSQS